MQKSNHLGLLDTRLHFSKTSSSQIVRHLNNNLNKILAILSVLIVYYYKKAESLSLKLNHKATPSLTYPHYRYKFVRANRIFNIIRLYYRMDIISLKST